MMEPEQRKRLSDDEIRAMVASWEGTVSVGPPGIYLLVKEALARGAVLAGVERERDEVRCLLRSYDDPRVTRWWLQRDEIKSRLRELEEENERLRDQILPPG